MLLLKKVKNLKILNKYIFFLKVLLFYFDWKLCKKIFSKTLIGIKI